MLPVAKTLTTTNERIYVVLQRYVDTIKCKNGIASYIT